MTRVDPRAASMLQPWLLRLQTALAAGHVCVACPADEFSPDGILVGQPGAYAPLLHDGERLYFARHWQEERAVAERLLALAQTRFELPPSAARLLRDYFWEGETGQCRAARQALCGALSVIAGGPGTGKTTTVLRLLAVLLASSPKALKVALAAPTGKAAQRVSESLRTNKGSISDLLIRAAIPETAQTLHRLLGYNPDTGQIRHHAANPLDLDVLIVDEASMIDLGLMARLLAALPPQARLILLGDPDQLPSVEAGAVFADLCGLAGGPVAERVARLTESHRFTAESGIGRLARAVNDGDLPGVHDLLAETQRDLAWHESWNEAELARFLAEAYAPYRRAIANRAPINEVFAAFNAFRILCSRHAGPSGVARLNQLAQQVLFGHGQEWYAGRPLLIGRNDYSLGVFNGDVGIVLAGQNGFEVWFETESDGFRSLSPARLPAYETAFAMTVHKSQGGEFDAVMLLLPDEGGQGETRNLVYTAITRARKRMTLWAREEALLAAIGRVDARFSGLAVQLAG